MEAVILESEWQGSALEEEDVETLGELTSRLRAGPPWLEVDNQVAWQRVGNAVSALSQIAAVANDTEASATLDTLAQRLGEVRRLRENAVTDRSRTPTVVFNELFAAYVALEAQVEASTRNSGEWAAMRQACRTMTCGFVFDGYKALQNRLENLNFVGPVTTVERMLRRQGFGRCGP